MRYYSPDMRTWGVLLALTGCVATAACDGDTAPPPPTPSPQGEERITGNERLGWDQQAPHVAELASYRYATYVDGARSELTDTSCENTAGAQGFACHARLPAMSAGSHTLQLATFVIDNTVLESDRSAPIRVFVGSAILSSATGWPTNQVITTADRLRFRLDLVTDRLEGPTDLAFAPDGRIFLAERAGRVRIIQQGRLDPDLALALDDVATTNERGLLALAIDPLFQRTGFVYLIYTARSANGTAVFRLARFREGHNRLAERAVLLDDIPAASARPAASLRFGADLKLYVAFDDGGNATIGDDLASYNGKVLRLNPDGTTPTGQNNASPVHAYTVRSPRGFDWAPTTGMLWIADAGTDQSERLSVIAEGQDRLMRRTVGAKYALPPGTGVSSMSFYRSLAADALRGDLLIAAQEGQYILRLQFDRNDPARIIASERLLESQVGPVRVVGVSPRGDIYFCTSDALAKLSPT